MVGWVRVFVACILAGAALLVVSGWARAQTETTTIRDIRVVGAQRIEQVLWSTVPEQASR